MSVSGLVSIGVCLVSAVPSGAIKVPMLVLAGGSDLVCVTVPGLCSLVTADAASMDALAFGADEVVASAP